VVRLRCEDQGCSSYHGFYAGLLAGRPQALPGMARLRLWLLPDVVSLLTTFHPTITDGT
jgi:hypothetical protein